MDRCKKIPPPKQNYANGLKTWKQFSTVVCKIFFYTKHKYKCEYYIMKQNKGCARIIFFHRDYYVE